MSTRATDPTLASLCASRARTCLHEHICVPREPVAVKATLEEPAHFRWRAKPAKGLRRLPLYTCSGHATGRTGR